MATDNFIYQGQGRLSVTLNTNVDLSGAYATEIEYLTPSRIETVISASVSETTKLTANIAPIPDEYGFFQFQSRVTFASGESPVLGRPVRIYVYKKWENPVAINIT